MAFINPDIEARHYRKEGESYVCELCPHYCRIAVDGFGRCGSRKGEADKLVAYNYGKVSSIALDPVEKKPFYHYHPKEKVFSVGSIGCNLSCRFCQNYSISMSPAGKKRTTFEYPDEVTALCRQERTHLLAFTYNEPVIWFEYMIDVMLSDPGIEYSIVTNGFINEGPMRELCRYFKAMNIDIKGFTDQFYREICGGSLEPVLKAVKVASEEGVHIELTYMVIPGRNDDDGEIAMFSEWVRDNVSPDTPVHFTRFHPDYMMMDVGLTPVDSLLKCREIAINNGLNYVYVGNILTEDSADTYCPECGNLVIRRTGYQVDIVSLDGNRCTHCRHRQNIIR